jgi:hypothetical protein
MAWISSIALATSAMLMTFLMIEITQTAGQGIYI